MGHAPQQFPEGAMQPDQNCSRLAEKREILRLSRCSAAQRNESRAILLGGLAQNTDELRVFDFAEFTLAALRENFRDGLFRSFDDALIEIHMLAADLPGQQSGNGGFPGAHETRQADDHTRTRINCHLFEV